MTASTPETKENGGHDDTTSANIKIEDLQLGVWTLRVAVPLKFEGPRKYWDQIQTFVPLFCRLSVEIFNISPYYLTVYLVCKLTTGGLEDFFLLGLSDKLLKIMETGILKGTFNSAEIMYTVVSRLMLTFLFSWLKWYSDRAHVILHDKVTSHFQLLLMKSNLELDLATSQEPGSKSSSNAREAWDALESIINISTDLLKSGGMWLILISLSHPVLSAYISHSLWDKVCYGFISNPIYQRIKALEKFANGTLRQEVISGGLAGWITNEYQTAHNQLGTRSSMHPYYQFEHEGAMARDIFLETLEFAPMVFCAVNAAMNPGNFTVSSVAILQQSSTHLRYSLRLLLHRLQSLNRSLTALKNIYRVETVMNTMKQGIIPYPNPNRDQSSSGMSFELSNVNFSYPGSQSKTAALTNVSLNIKAGQLVIIVGANGSGKSTLIRLLSRLYDPTSGTVLIDDRPSVDYVVSDLHQATTLLSQDSNLYPLSLGENIGLGHPPNSQDAKLIAQAAEDGGATEFISKLKDGMDTILEPQLDVFQIHLYNDKTHVLYKEMEALKKKIDVSGGERQKVAAARSFMRFKSGKIKFVAVDEPSSALDAEAELKLFENLIKARHGKTMVFVTHRFGHLTRYADQIICMKDGSIFESGSHETLIKKQGEYAKLYDIQASAFAQGSPKNESLSG